MDLRQIQQELRKYIKKCGSDIDYLSPADILEFCLDDLFKTIDFTSSVHNGDYEDIWIFQCKATDKFYKLKLEYGSFGDPSYEDAIDELVEVFAVTRMVTKYEELE